MKTTFLFAVVALFANVASARNTRGPKGQRSEKTKKKALLPTLSCCKEGQANEIGASRLCCEEAKANEDAVVPPCCKEGNANEGVGSKKSNMAVAPPAKRVANLPQESKEQHKSLMSIDLFNDNDFEQRVDQQRKLFSNPEINLSAIDLFNPADQQLFIDFAEKATTEQEAIQPLFDRERPVAAFCARDANCAQGLSCISKRCLPSTDSCLAEATNNFMTAFDEAAWKANLFKSTGLSQETIEDAARTSMEWENFQQSSTLNQLKAAARDSLPMEQGRLLQDAVNACDADKQDEGGTVVYLAIHIEFSAGVDLAATIIWTVGGGATIEFTRGTFGGEFGAGVEMSFVVGFIFTNGELTDLDLTGGAVVTDFDIGFGFHTGLTVISNFNGLVSIEVAAGPGIGGGIGVGWSITAITRGITVPPTQSPVSAPVPAPKPTGGGGLGSAAPSAQPSQAPSISQVPSKQPSQAPSISSNPSSQPSRAPSISQVPSKQPSQAPSISQAPSKQPSQAPSKQPSQAPSISQVPSKQPSQAPSISSIPSTQPSQAPSVSQIPSKQPSQAPSISSNPSSQPSQTPSVSQVPSKQPSQAPSSQPSQAPSKQPSQAPSVSTIPSQAPSISQNPTSVCFPGDALLEEEHRGIVAMKDLAVGDKILTPSGFSEVYGFAMGILDTVGEFVSLSTGPFEPKIELTAFHQVFIGSHKTTKYAKDVKVGDVLVLKDRKLPVTEVEIVFKQGIYSPYTLDGTMFVNGVLASCFAYSPYVAIGSVEIITKHQLKFMFHAPARMLCTSAFAPYAALCSHDDNFEIGASILVDSTLKKAVPGFMQDDVNYLTWDNKLLMRLMLLLFWILPMYWLEQQGGMVALASAALGGWILYKATKRNKLV